VNQTDNHILKDLLEDTIPHNKTFESHFEYEPEGNKQDSPKFSVVSRKTFQNTWKFNTDTGKCPSCGRSYNDPGYNTTNAFEYYRPAHQLEIQSLKRTIDELCEDNQILHNDVQDSLKVIEKLTNKIKELQKELKAERAKTVSLPLLEYKLKTERVLKFVFIII